MILVKLTQSPESIHFTRSVPNAPNSELVLRAVGQQHGLVLPTGAWLPRLLLLPRLPSLVFEAVASPAVHSSDAVEGADEQQSPRDPNAHRSQHPRHITCLLSDQLHPATHQSLVALDPHRGRGDEAVGGRRGDLRGFCQVFLTLL